LLLGWLLLLLTRPGCTPARGLAGWLSVPPEWGPRLPKGVWQQQAAAAAAGGGLVAGSGLVALAYLLQGMAASWELCKPLFSAAAAGRSQAARHCGLATAVYPAPASHVINKPMKRPRQFGTG